MSALLFDLQGAMAAPCAAASRRAQMLPGLYGGDAASRAGSGEAAEGAAAWRVAERGSLRALERREPLDLEAATASAARSLEALAKLRLNLGEAGQAPLAPLPRLLPQTPQTLVPSALLQLPAVSPLAGPLLASGALLETWVAARAPHPALGAASSTLKRTRSCADGVENWGSASNMPAAAAAACSAVVVAGVAVGGNASGGVAGCASGCASRCAACCASGGAAAAEAERKRRQLREMQEAEGAAMEAARRSRFFRRVEAIVAVAATSAPTLGEPEGGARRAAANEEDENHDDADGEQSRWYSSFLDKIERVA